MTTTATDATPATIAARARSASLRAALPIAREEYKRLLVQPLLAVGIGLTIVVTGVGIGREAVNLRREGAMFGLLVWPLAGMTLVAANRMTSRARRHRTAELFDTLPVPQETRTLGFMLALVAPVLYACGLAALFVGVPLVGDGVGMPPVSEIAVGLVLVACAGVVGILLERLARRSMLAPLVVVGIGFLEGGMASDARSRAWHVLAPWDPQPGVPPELWIRPSGWHVVYLLGIMALLGAAAVAVHRRSRRVVLAGAAALAVTVAAGVVQQQFPTAAQLRRSTTFLAHPEKVQRCSDRGGAEYCVYPRYDYLIAQWRPPIDGVLTRVPQKARAQTLRVTQRLRGDHYQFLEPEQLAALPFAVPPDGLYVYPDDGAIHPHFDSCARNLLYQCQMPLAVKVASWATGLPIANERNQSESPEEPLTTAYDSSGEARAVVALWLAGGATRATRIALAPWVEPNPHEDTGGCGFKCEPRTTVRLGPCDDVHDVSVEFSYTDIGYARELLRLPSQDVQRTLARHWERLVNPHTPTAELAALFGLAKPEGSLLARPYVLRC